MSSYYHESWKDVLEKEFSSNYFHTIANHLKNEYKHQTIFPKKEDVFRAFLLTPINKTKVVKLISKTNIIKDDIIIVKI